MVSNEDIREKLEGKRNGINTHDIIQESHETTSDNFNIVCPECGTENPSISNFCSECGKPIEVKPGYVVCDVCYGIYELEEEESPEDFVKSQCHCGGNLTYIQDMDELEDLTKNCPICGHVNPYHVKMCEGCGRCFDVGIEYFESPFYDIEITPTALRIYNKQDNKLRNVYQYDMDSITDFSIVKESLGYKITFNYENNNLNFIISSKQAFNLKKLDFASQKMVGCTNPHCMHIRLLNENEKCPECGLKSEMVEITSYKKLTSSKREKRMKFHVNKSETHTNKFNVDNIYPLPPVGGYGTYLQSKDITTTIWDDIDNNEAIEKIKEKNLFYIELNEVIEDTPETIINKKKNNWNRTRNTIAGGLIFGFYGAMAGHILTDAPEELEVIKKSPNKRIVKHRLPVNVSTHEKGIKIIKLYQLSKDTDYRDIIKIHWNEIMDVNHTNDLVIIRVVNQSYITLSGDIKGLKGLYLIVKDLMTGLVEEDEGWK